MQLYTLGFTQKSAQEFFEILAVNQVQVLVDIRLKPGGQLSGFAKGADLAYFIPRLVPGARYVHLLELAPTQQILEGYRQDKDWPRYAAAFEALMDGREIPARLERDLFTQNRCCLLCSEALPQHCHRRLVAERLARHWPEIEVIHL